MRTMAGYGSSATADATWWQLRTVDQKALKWLWPGRVPLGKVTLIVGDPGRGKSLLALDMAARVTRGAAWPDQAVGSAECGVGREEPRGVSAGEGQGDARVESGSAGVGPPEAALEPLDPAFAALCGVVEWPDAVPEARDAVRETGDSERGGGNAERGTPNPVGSVVLLSAEDDAGDTILPRLKAAGGDPERVIILNSLRRREDNSQLTFSLSRDLALLDYEMRARGDVRLVILDPVTAYLGGLHGHSNAEVRELLAPLRELAENRRAAVVGISHLTKKSDAALMYRTMGSVAFVAASRAVWAVGADRREPGRMLFLPVKCNLRGGATGLAFRIQGSAADPSVPVLAWEDEAVTETAEEALGAARRAPAAELAAMWLRGLLAAGPMASRDVDHLAVAAGISPTALRKARKALGVEGCPDGKRGNWLVRLPGDEVAGLALPEGGAEAAVAESSAEGEAQAAAS